MKCQRRTATTQKIGNHNDEDVNESSAELCEGGGWFSSLASGSATSGGISATIEV